MSHPVRQLPYVSIVLILSYWKLPQAALCSCFPSLPAPARTPRRKPRSGLHKRCRVPRGERLRLDRWAKAIAERPAPKGHARPGRQCEVVRRPRGGSRHKGHARPDRRCEGGPLRKKRNGVAGALRFLKKNRSKLCIACSDVAEAVGFEPTVPFTGLLDFESRPL